MPAAPPGARCRPSNVYHTYYIDHIDHTDHSYETYQIAHGYHMYISTTPACAKPNMRNTSDPQNPNACNTASGQSVSWVDHGIAIA
ncbi:MAG TPA: hypothetical protein VI703_01390 [Anaerolineales bacterium]|nr:hypothetical protein [Anaerolineales bacterium]